MELLRKLILPALLILALAIMVGGAFTSGLWLPKLNYVVDRLIKSEDQGASDKIAKEGANETVKQLDVYVKNKTKIEARTNHAIGAIRAAPSATRVPRADADRLWASDDGLCKLGVACSSEASIDGAGDAAPAPVTRHRQGTVRPVRPTEDPGNTVIN